MSLAMLVAKEFGVSLDRVMLLRHSSQSVSRLLAAGSSVEEYTFTQPTGSSYDYAHPTKGAIEIVVVVVEDRVFGVYRVLGIESEGTTYSLTSEAHQRFDSARGKAPRAAKRFRMEALPSPYAGLPISGWEGGRSRTAVQRSQGSFFLAIAVEADSAPIESSALQQRLRQSVNQALADTSTQRRRRLTLATKLSRRIRVTSWEFVRNPDVIAEVLHRAEGRCESCGAAAPFTRSSDGSPYLEVHHKQRLADGGEDTIVNALALCPNCHRREHYA